MASMRMCTDCGRPNGPHFPRCMNCGAWLGVLDPEDGGPRSLEDAAMRARRLLEGMTPARRALLPPEFLQSVQIQASGRIEEPLEDAVTEPKLEAVPVPEPDPHAGGFDELPSAPEWLPGEIPIELSDSLLGRGDTSLLEPDDEWDSVDRLPGDMDVDPDAQVSLSGPAWGHPSSSGHRQPAPSSSVDPPEEYADDRTSAPGLALLDLHTGPETHALPPDALPLVEVLSRGRGPFGPRDAPLRLVLLPDPDYKRRSSQLKHRLKAVLDIDLYTGVLFLHRRIPTHLAAGSDVAGLRTAATELRRAGLRVLLIDRDRWLEGAMPRRLASLRGDRPGPVTATTIDGQPITLERSGIEAAVFGTVPADEDVGQRAFWLLDLLVWRERAPLRIRSDEVNLDFLGDGNFAAPRTIARNLVAWLAEDPTRPPPIDDNFKHVPDSARSVRSPNPEIHPVEGDFTEYVLLHDLGRRT